MSGPAQRFGVLCDGTPCVFGLTWPEACAEASRLMQALAGEPDGAVVTLSEQSLDEPRLSWMRVAGGWHQVAPPSWEDAA